MDTALKFKPRTILLWRRLANDPEALRISSLFPSAELKIVDRQRAPARPDVSSASAVLEGKRTLMIGNTTSFVHAFDGSPGPGICCRAYYKLVPASNGCPYYCTYCYLAFIYRKYAPFIKLNINYDTMYKQIRRTLAAGGPHTTFNMGEMLDSLALDHITNLTPELVEFFAGLSAGHLMLLTKSSNVDNLLKAEPNSRIVVSWSLNSDEAVSRYEPGTADLQERLIAARRCQQHGYRIRIRIDPGILTPNWPDEYTALIDRIFGKISPENITLGMLRLVPGHTKLASGIYRSKAEPLPARQLTQKALDGKLRYHPKERITFYRFLIDLIRSRDRKVSIGLCRETPEIWAALETRAACDKCNCLIW